MSYAAATAPQTLTIGERTSQAYTAGQQAQARGLQEVPAQDQQLRALLAGLALGQGVPIMQAWVKGYCRSLEQQQVLAFADTLGQRPAVEAQLAGGINDVSLSQLWWELFHQLRDAA